MQTREVRKTAKREEWNEIEAIRDGQSEEENRKTPGERRNVNEGYCERARKMEIKIAENILDRMKVGWALALTEVLVCASWTSQTVENSLFGAHASSMGQEDGINLLSWWWWWLGGVRKCQCSKSKTTELKEKVLQLERKPYFVKCINKHITLHQLFSNLFSVRPPLCKVYPIVTP